MYTTLLSPNTKYIIIKCANYTNQINKLHVHHKLLYVYNSTISKRFTGLRVLCGYLLVSA